MLHTAAEIQLRQEADRAHHALHADSFEGSVLVVDVSGFTALTADMEARHGRRGADRLATLMDGLLGALGDIAERHCGTVVDIVGDSLQIIWATSPSEDLEVTTAQAADAALAMLAHAATKSAEAGTRLIIRAGLAAGQLVRADVGGHDGQYDRLLWGPALIDAALMTAVARPGTAAVTDSAQALVQAHFADRRRESWWELGEADHADIEACAIGHAPLDMGVGWSAELRSATILFVRLYPTEDLARLTLEDVNASVRMVQAAAARHGGIVDKVHVDEKGMSAVVGFGIPPAPVTAAAVRALAAATDLRAEMRDHGANAAIGVATGKVRAGIGGTGSHVHHTIYGAAANLAARCMQAAQDEVLTDAPTRREAGESFEYFLPEARALKGIPADTLLFGVGNPKRRQAESALADTAPIAGRAQELADIKAFFFRPESRLLILEGEVGVGKSRLAAYAAGLASTAGHEVHVARAGPLGSRTPLYAWRDTAAALLANWARARSLRLDDAVVALVEDAGADKLLASLANPLFGRTLADSPALAQMEQDARPRLARSLHAKVMQQLLGPSALLLVLEDAHWLDDASAQLAADLLAALPAARAIIAGRTPLDVAPLLLLPDSPDGLFRMQLLPMSREGTADYARFAIPGFKPGHPVVDWLHARARGNPLFTRELLASIPAGLLADGLISPGAWRDAEVALRKIDLPATIEDAAIARLGAQPFERLGLLKAASIFGSAFDAAAIAALDVPVPAEQLPAELDALADEGLLVREGDDPPRWRFAQALVMSAVYESLPERIRAPLHRLAVEHLERQSPKAARAMSAEIAHHWHQAGVPDRALQPLRRAGQAATAAGAYADALQFFERALDIVEARPGLISPLRRAQLNLELANAQMSIGENVKALEPALNSLDGLWKGTPKTKAGWSALAVREAALLATTIFIPQFRAREQASIRSRTENRLRCEAATRASDLYYLIDGSPVQPVALSLFAARAAERTGDLSIAARPYGLIGYIAGIAKLERISRFCLNRAHADCTAQEDHGGLHRVHGAKAMLATSLARWDEGRPHIQASVALNSKDASERNGGMALSIAAMFELWQGNFAASRAHALALQALAQSVLDDQFLMWAELHLGRVEWREGNAEAAAAHFAEGLRLLSRCNEAQSHFSLDILLTQCRLAMGHTEGTAERAEYLVRAQEDAPTQFASVDAFAATADVLLQLFAAGNKGLAPLAERSVQRLRKYAALFPIGQPFARLHEGQLLALKGKDAAARKIWLKGLKEAGELQMPLEEARLHAALAASGEAGPHAACAAAIVARLGAGPLPALPIRMKDAPA